MVPVMRATLFCIVIINLLSIPDSTGQEWWKRELLDYYYLLKEAEVKNFNCFFPHAQRYNELKEKMEDSWQKCRETVGKGNIYIMLGCMQIEANDDGFDLRADKYALQECMKKAT